VSAAKVKLNRVSLEADDVAKRIAVVAAELACLQESSKEQAEEKVGEGGGVADAARPVETR
jgi:hypothetical protein